MKFCPGPQAPRYPTSRRTWTSFELRVWGFALGARGLKALGSGHKPPAPSTKKSSREFSRFNSKDHLNSLSLVQDHWTSRPVAERRIEPVIQKSPLHSLHTLIKYISRGLQGRAVEHLLYLSCPALVSPRRHGNLISMVNDEPG